MKKFLVMLLVINCDFKITEDLTSLTPKHRVDAAHGLSSVT